MNLMTDEPYTPCVLPIEEEGTLLHSMAEVLAIPPIANPLAVLPEKMPEEVDLFDLSPQEQTLIERLRKLGLSLEEIQSGLSNRSFLPYCSGLVDDLLSDEEKLQHIRFFLEHVVYRQGKSLRSLGRVPEKVTCPVSPQEQIERAAFLVSLPEHVRRMAERLLYWGFSLSEIRQAFRHPKFPSFVAQVLGLLVGGKLSEIKAVESIRYGVEQIAKLSDEEIAQSMKRPKSINKKKRQSQARSISIRGLSILAALWDKSEVSLEEIVKLTGISERRVRDTLANLEKNSVIVRKKCGRKNFYSLTHYGVVLLKEKLSRTFLQCQLPEPLGKGHCKNVREAIVEILKKAQKITKELAKLGWWYRGIHKVLMIHKLDYILAWIERIKKNPAIENPGAYLWAVLMRQIPDEKRKEAMAKKILAGMNEEIVATYLEEASQKMSCSQALHLALAIRSLKRKCSKRGWAFSRGDILGIANWVRNRRRVA